MHYKYIQQVGAMPGGISICTIVDEYHGIKCPHCGEDSGIEPALLDPVSPMPYCPACDEPLFGDSN